MLERLKESLPGQVVQRYLAANAGIYATVVAYNAVFAMFPIILAILFVLSLIVRDPAILDWIEAIIGALFPGDVAAETIAVLRDTGQSSGWLGLLSFLGLLWAGSGLFGALAVAFNRIYRVPDRPLWRERITGTLMIFLFVALLLLTLIATTVAQVILQFADRLPIANLPGFAAVATIVSYAISLGAAIALFLALYYVVPNVRLSLRDVWPGTLLGALLFVLLIQVFPLYVHTVARFGRFGAVFGFIFLVLTWLTFVAHVLLLGAALNAVLKQKPEPRVAGCPGNSP